MSCSILVPEQVVKSVMKRLSRLAKKAGVSVELVKGATPTYRKKLVIKRYRDGWGEVREIQTLEVDTTQLLECARVTVGEMPKHNGHNFLGKIYHTAAGNLLAMARHARNVQMPVEWRTAKPTCDHCNTKRGRNETFVIQTPEGEIKRVGRNCLADFLKEDPSSLIDLALFEDEFRTLCEQDPDSDGCWGGGMRWTPSMNHFLNCCFSSVESRGFQKADSEHPTKHDAMWLADSWNYTNCKDPAMRADWKKRQPTEAHQVEAIGALLWLADEPRDSDYMHSLHVALLQPSVTRMNSGLAASVPAMYARHLGKLAAKQVEVPSKHVGAKGERLDLEVVVTEIRGYSTTEGEPKTIVKACTPDGAEVITFTGGKHPLLEEIGKKFSVRGTVKDHTIRNGRHQTVLSRCVWS